MEDKVNAPATVGKYHPGIHDRLNSFRVAHQLQDENRRHIADLGHEFLRHGVHEWFGLCLLHKRFDLFGDEYLVRTFELRHGVVYKSPVPRRMYAIPCSWRAQRGPRGQWLFYPIEFISYGEPVERRAEEFEKLGPFLFDIAQQLENFGVLDVFGISTTGILALPCRDDEILVETANLRRRLITVQPEARSEAKLDELTETFWTFHRDGGTAVRCRTVASAIGDSVAISPYATTSMRGLAAASLASL